MFWDLLPRDVHNPITQDFARKLRKLDRFAGLVESHLAAQADELGVSVEAGAERLPEGQRQEYYEYHAEDFYELGDELPSILRYAALTAADTAMEVYLADTCATFAELQQTSVRPQDLAGRGIVRSQQYLKKVAGVTFPDARPPWGQVLRLHALRNSVVHADGVLTTGLAELRTWAPTFPGVRITDRGVLMLGPGFTDAALSAYAAFAADFDAACEPLGLWHSVFPPLTPDEG